MGHEKPIYRGELPKRKRLGEFADLRENLVKKRSGCDFEGMGRGGGNTPIF